MSLADIRDTLNGILEPQGFECHPFKIGWYNDMVSSDLFHFDYPPDTLAFVIISTPNMFDKAFKPFICKQECTGARDPIDECVEYYFTQAKQAFLQHDISAIHDYELLPSRRPKVLVQTAGHVAGAAYYYQKSDVKQSPWKEKQKIYGVSIHPKYGGWFALRGVLIFKDVQVPELPKQTPPDVLVTDEKKIELLERFNYRWQDWTFRDVLESDEKYSEEQKTYFATPPKERLLLIKGIKADLKQTDTG